MLAADVLAEKFDSLAAHLAAYEGYNNLRVVRALATGGYRSNSSRRITIEELAEEVTVPKLKLQGILQIFSACGIVLYQKDCDAYQLNATAEGALAEVFFELFNLQPLGPEWIEEIKPQLTTHSLSRLKDSVLVAYLSALSHSLAVKAIYHVARSNIRAIPATELRTLLYPNFKSFPVRDRRLDLQGIWRRDTNRRTLLQPHLIRLPEMLIGVFGLSPEKAWNLLQSFYAAPE